jgi:hypothetical protein
MTNTAGQTQLIATYGHKYIIRKNSVGTALSRPNLLKPSWRAPGSGSTNFLNATTPRPLRHELIQPGHILPANRLHNGIDIGLHHFGSEGMLLGARNESEAVGLGVGIDQVFFVERFTKARTVHTISLSALGCCWASRTVRLRPIIGSGRSLKRTGSPLSSRDT